MNESWKFFQKIFNRVFNEVAPVKEVRLKQHTESWMTPDILDIIKERDNLYHQRNSGQKEDNKMFCEMRKKAQREIRKSQTKYFSNNIKEDKDKQKNLWNHIEDIVLKKTTNAGQQDLTKYRG